MSDLTKVALPPLVIGTLNLFIAEPKPGMEWFRPVLPLVGLALIIVDIALWYRRKRS